MRRREYLRSTVAGLGLTGLSTTALAAAGDDAGESPSSDAVRAPASDSATPTTVGATTTAGGGDDALAPLARLDVTNDTGGFQATEVAVTPDGSHAFVSTVTGFHVVDVSTPENPEIVATVEDILADQGGPMRSLFDLKYNRGRLVVATEGGSPLTGIALFDVTDPTDPQFLRVHETTFSIHNADLHGNHAYLTNGRELVVVDVSRDDPERVATWGLTDYDEAYADVSFRLANLHDIYVQGGRAYLAYWDAGTWILDVSDPANPTHVGHATEYTAAELADLSGADVVEHGLEPAGNDHYVQPSDDGTLLAVGAESWDIEGDNFETDEPEEEDTGGPSGITLWDVTDPASPERLSTIDPPPVPEGENATYTEGYWTTSHNFEIAGDYLYSSWYRGGVKVHDISDPASPVELGHWADGAVASFWTAQVGVPGEYFVASSYQHPTEDDGPGGFYVFPDPSDNAATVTPSGPAVVTQTATPTETPTPSPTPTATPSPTPTDSPTPTASPTASPTPTDSPTPTPTEASTETTSGDGPGLGVLTALGALGIGAWGALRSGDEE